MLVSGKCPKVGVSLSQICPKQAFGPKKGLEFSLKPLILLVLPAGFEPAAHGFEVRHSIQLSYGSRGKRLVLGDVAVFVVQGPENEAEGTESCEQNES